MRHQHLLGQSQRRYGLVASNGGVVLQELVQRIPGFQVVEAAREPGHGCP